MHAHRTHAIAAFIEEQWNDRNGADLAVAVLMEEDVRIFRRYAGKRLNEKEGILTETCFPICSVSKTLTATAILQLVEHGILSLDEPVLTYLGGSLPADHGLTREVTLQRLLSHTAGFTRWHAPPAFSATTTLDGYIRQVLPSHPRHAAPGVVHDYSNFGINLAGYVAEVAAKQPFADLVQNLLFEPLEMIQTSFARDTGPSFPAGSAVSTVSDLMQYARMLLDGGFFRGRQVLTPTSLEALWTPRASLYLPNGASRGLAFRLDTYKGIRRFGHAGRSGTSGSHLRSAADDKLAVILLAQGLEPRTVDKSLTTLEDRLFDLLLNLPPTHAAPSFATLCREQWPTYAGNYVGHEQGLARIKQAQGHLILEWKGEQTDIYPLQNDLYVGVAEDAPAVGFIPASTKATPAPYIMLNGRPLQRTACADGGLPDCSTWTALTGMYQHPALSGARVFIREKKLCIAFDWLGGWLSCQPLGLRRFACRLGLVEFQGEDGNVASFAFRTSCVFKRCR